MKPQLLGNKWYGTTLKTIKTYMEKGEGEKNPHVFDKRKVEVKVRSMRIGWDGHGHPLDDEKAYRITFSSPFKEETFT